jgi:hypothetical protein
LLDSLLGYLVGCPAARCQAEPVLLISADPAAADQIVHCGGQLGRVAAQERFQRLGELGGTGRAAGERVEHLPVPAGQLIGGEGPAEAVVDQPVEVLEPVADRPVGVGRPR